MNITRQQLIDFRSTLANIAARLNYEALHDIYMLFLADYEEDPENVLSVLLFNIFMRDFIPRLEELAQMLKDDRDTRGDHR